MTKNKLSNELPICDHDWMMHIEGHFVYLKCTHCDLENRNGLSYSKVGATECMQFYKFSYVDKKPQPKSDIMLMGILFDKMCSTRWCNKDYDERDPFKLLSPGDHTNLSPELSINQLIIVEERYLEYCNYRDADGGWETSRHQVPVWKWVEGTDWYLYGWVDEVAVGEGEKPEKLIDYKFSTYPWPIKTRKDGSYSSSRSPSMQARTYKVCFRANTGLGLPFEFHVLNSKTYEVQIIEERPTKKSLLGVDEWARKAIERIEKGEYKPNYGCDKCGWCPYFDDCPAIQRLNMKSEDFRL